MTERKGHEGGRQSLGGKGVSGASSEYRQFLDRASPGFRSEGTYSHQHGRLAPSRIRRVASLALSTAIPPPQPFANSAKDAALSVKTRVGRRCGSTITRRATPIWAAAASFAETHLLGGNAPRRKLTENGRVQVRWNAPMRPEPVVSAHAIE